MGEKDFDIKEMVKDNQVHFSFYRANVLYYEIEHRDKTYIFPVPIEDIGEATFHSEDKAIYFMRYIRQAIKNNMIEEKVEKNGTKEGG